MQQTEIARSQTEKRRADAVAGTLAAMKSCAGTLAEVAHDARNMVTALSLYCDLLSEHGALTPACRHYAGELRLIASASRRLVEKLTVLDMEGADADETFPSGREHGETSKAQAGRQALIRLPNDPIANLQEELLANRNLLDAMAGLGVAIGVRVEGGAYPVRLAGEDLTRVLVNLVKNAAEALHGTGTVAITLRERPGLRGGAESMVLSVEDNGPGLPAELGQKIFEPGCSTHAPGEECHSGGWPVAHRGLGLSIARSIVEAAGGSIAAGNRPEGGARFDLELPISNR
ncbi:MAG TPA: sensor histidine kinase [Terracidiphilus sp.]|jgi:signal transduction histidine kinase